MLDSELPAKIQRDLELAAEMQRNMLPERVPTAPGYSFWTSWLPALPVGGDMYDFRTLETGEILLLVADVAGKGLGAAIGMASLVGMVPIVLEQTGPDLGKFISRLNRGIFQWASRVNRFVTLIAVGLDPVRHRLRVVNAAHHAGFIRRQDGTLENLCPEQQAGLALGVVQEFPYMEIAIGLKLGDAVVITSDGITNAINANGEEYGTSRLHQVLVRTEPEARKLGEAVLDDVKSFMGDLRMEDDVVMVCFARHV